MAQLRDAVGTKGLFTDGDWILSENMDKAGAIGVIQLKHVGVGEFLRKDFQFISEKTFRDLKCTEVRLGDVLISRMADPIARACIVPRLPFRLVTAVDVSILRVDERTADPLFISHLCNSSVIRNQAETAGRGTTRSRITRTELEELDIPLPELTEQKRIAGLLEQANRLRRTRRYALDLSDTFLPAAFLELFGEPSSNPQRWPVRRIAEVAIGGEKGITTGPFGTQLGSDDFVQEGIEVFGIYSVGKNGKFISGGNKRITPNKYRELARFAVHPGDVLCSRMGTIGRPAVVPAYAPNGIVSYHLLRIRPDPKACNPTFLSNLIAQDSTQNVLARLSHGAIMSGLNAKIVAALPIYVPPLDLQMKFLRVCVSHERLRARQREALRQAEHLFQSLLHQAFPVRS